MAPEHDLPELTRAICAFCILLIPVAACGLALINCGLGRSRHAAHTMVASLLAFAVAACVYFAVGFSWQGWEGRATYGFRIGGHFWNWIGADPWFMGGVDFAGSSVSLAAWFGMFSAGVAALIPVGSAGQRWKLSGICGSTALLAGITYPIFAHWVWGGGWLAQLGENYGLGRGFADAGGASTIHAVGGLTALAATWILGARRGKFQQGMPSALPGHNTVFVLMGCMLALIGWMGLNAAGSILFEKVEAGRIAQIAIGTLLTASASALASAMMTKTKFGKPDASLTANAWVGGLVASSAGCALVMPVAGLVVGAGAGILVTLSIEWLELHLHVDDPGGAVSVHGVAAIWGLLVLGLFPHLPGSSGSGQWLAQLAGVATLIGFVLPVSYGLNWTLNRFAPQRVTAEGERQGMDLHELGANAYPELASHGEE